MRSYKSADRYTIFVAIFRAYVDPNVFAYIRSNKNASSSAYIGTYYDTSCSSNICTNQ